MGRGLFALRRRLLKKEKSILHMENGGPWTKSGVIPTDSALFCPS
jgi:hypothetical protein